MNLEMGNDASSFLENLPAKQYKQVTGKILSLLRNPYPHDAKHLKDAKGYRRVTSGEYRIAYTVVGETIKVVLVGKRNDDEIYRDLARKGL